MSAPNAHAHADEREIARGLALAVASAVESVGGSADARALAWGAATGVAELLGLGGLVALLAACEPHADAPPVAVRNVLERLARLATKTEAQGRIEPFVAAEGELAALAGVIGAQDWDAPDATDSARSAPEAMQSLAELLTDFELDDAAAVARARVTLPVAAGVRAALDWLGAELGGPLHVTVHDASLTLAVRVAHEAGLGPAGAMLGLMGGSLLPEPAGRWALRVPLHAARPAFLLARQGELSLALPWHAVVRLRIADEAARLAQSEPSLAPWSPLAREAGERPAALIAHGLSQAWLQLDHIVWRVFATPAPAQAPAALPGGRSCVRTEEGAEYWVVDAELALAAVAPQETPPPRARVHAVSEPVASAAPVTAAVPEPVPPLVISHDTPPPPAPAPALLVLTPEHVRPLLATPPVAPPAAATPAPQVPRRALIVDDSLVTRIALARVLEREGWVVEGAERADEMWTALEADDWAAVFVDVSLPDASGRAHLRSLVARSLVTRTRFELVALTRDAGEARLAGESGIRRSLQKPFAAGAVEALLRELSTSAASA